MATKQSAYFKGMARTPFPAPHKSGSVCEVIFSHVFTQDVNTTDVLELVPFIPFGRIVGFDFSAENIGAINLTMGLMTGTPGDVTSVRTNGSELISAAVSTTPLASTLLQLASLAKNGGDAKSIGLTVSANITAAANKKLHIRLRYTT